MEDLGLLPSNRVGWHFNFLRDWADALLRECVDCALHAARQAAWQHWQTEVKEPPWLGNESRVRAAMEGENERGLREHAGDPGWWAPERDPWLYARSRLHADDTRTNTWDALWDAAWVPAWQARWAAGWGCSWAAICPPALAVCPSVQDYHGFCAPLGLDEAWAALVARAWEETWARGPWDETMAARAAYLKDEMDYLRPYVPNSFVEAAGDARDAALVREIFGNPFRPAALSLSWLTPTATALAAAIYHERRFADLPMLADALEEAGCSSADVLAHCRQPVPHVRGCWVLDLLLGKT
jgi:hypothetical protein